MKAVWMIQFVTFWKPVWMNKASLGVNNEYDSLSVIMSKVLSLNLNTTLLVSNEQTSFLFFSLMRKKPVQQSRLLLKGLAHSPSRFEEESSRLCHETVPVDRTHHSQSSQSKPGGHTYWRETGTSFPFPFLVSSLSKLWYHLIGDYFSSRSWENSPQQMAPRNFHPFWLSTRQIQSFLFRVTGQIQGIFIQKSLCETEV